MIYAPHMDMTTGPLYAVSSTDGGITFGNRRVILTAQGWEKGVWGNSSCVILNGTWHLLYECYNQSNIWQMGYATSPNGITWTRQNGGNPITTLQVGTGMFGGPNLNRMSDGTWELFYHASTSGILPTDIYRAVSSDLIHWVRRPGTPILTRGDLFYEVDQVADACLLELGGQRFLFYGGADNTTGTGRINRAVYVPPT